MKSCARCWAKMELAALGNLSAEDKPLQISVEGMPAAKCVGTRGHTAPVDNDFMLWLIRELKERAAGLPGGEEKGMFLKKYICSCGAELASKAEGRRAFPFELSYEGAPAFKAVIDMPVYKCPGCAKEQLRSTKEAGKHVAQSIAALNDAAGFPHSG